MANKKVKKYKKPLNINIGMIIFSVVFVYVLVCVVTYFKTSHIVRYEVKEGALATNNIYRGVVLRDETVVYAQSNGYVNYYAREGSRVAKNDLVYVLDETGNLTETMESMNLGENSLSKRDAAEFRSEIVDFIHGFSSEYYGSTYDFKYGIKNTVLKLANVSMLDSIQNINSAGTSSIKYAHAPDTGIVSYWSDGYENLSPQGVTAELFDEKNYEKNRLSGNSLVAEGDIAYKISTNENWSVIIPIEPARGAELVEEEYVLVRFLKNQYKSWGQVKMLSNQDGTYLQLSFNNSMITFVGDRFLDIELIVEDEKGLKIPVTSIVQKDFYLIPESFVISDETSGKNTILRQCFLEDGTISSELLEVDVYNFDSENKEYYLDTSLLSTGDVLYKTDKQETFTVSRRATLIGVYNMNKGYADFKQIHILYQNEEYAIVKSNTKYGLSVYDYIALDAATVSDDQFINQGQ